MKTFLALGLVGLLARTALADGTVPGHVLVKPNSGVSIQAVATSYGVRVEDRVAGTNVYSLTVPATQTETGFATLLAADSRLVFAEVDTYLDSSEVDGDPVHLAFDAASVDPRFLEQWYAPLGVYALGSPLQQINLGLTHARTTGAGVTVAVLDTGIDYNHPLLQGHLLPGASMLNPESLPWERYDGQKNGVVGHGTMVSGIVLRVAPSARILPVRVLNGDGHGTARDVAKGIMYALQNGARVLNMSLSSPVRSKAVDEALDAAQLAGVSCIVSAGNLGTDERQYPTARKEVLVVGAVDSNNIKPGFSNYGNALSVVAPGVGIRSTYLAGGYATWSGTSFSAPYVSGEAALILQLKPAFTGSDIKSAIRGMARSVDSVNPLYKGALGKGLIDIAATIKKL